MSTTITEAQWARIYEFLKSCPGVYAGEEDKCRLFIEGVHWIARSGAQWRFLPAQYGNWNSVYKRFARWDDKGIWTQLHQYFATDPDMEHLILDSTIVRAHPCAAGASKKTVVRMNRLSDAAVVVSVPKSTSASMAWVTRYDLS